MKKLILISLVIFFTICSKSWAEDNYDQTIADSFGLLENPDDPCSIDNIAMINNVEDIQKTNLGNADNDYDPGF